MGPLSLRRKTNGVKVQSLWDDGSKACGLTVQSSWDDGSKAYGLTVQSSWDDGLKPCGLTVSVRMPSTAQTFDKLSGSHCGA